MRYIIDYQFRKIKFDDIISIKHFMPEKNKAGKFILKAYLKNSSIIIYQSVSTIDTWHYNKLELNYVLYCLVNFIHSNDESFDISDTVHFCRTQLFDSYTYKIIELKNTIKDLENKMQDIAKNIKIKEK